MLSIFVVGIVILVMVALYSMGQQTIAKIKLQNTADAAAYSVAVAEARDYNFAAYMNRAMIANQVAVAQVVGLTSWARNYGNTYNGRFSSLPNIFVRLGVSPMTSLWTLPWNVHRPISRGFKTAFDVGGPVTVKVLDVLIDTLGTAQTINHYGTALTIAEMLGLGATGILESLGVPSEFFDKPVIRTIKEAEDGYNIIKLNDPTAELSNAAKLVLVPAGLAQWFLFTQSKDPNKAAADGEKADRFAKVTMASLDEFSRNRRASPERFYLTPAPWVIDPTRFIPMQNGPFLMWLWHRGGTELKEDGSKKLTWSAMDATGFTGFGIFWIPPIPPFIPVPIPIVFGGLGLPMGYGAAQAGADGNLNPTNNFDQNAGDAYGGVYSGVNTAAGAVVQRGMGPGASMGKLYLSSGGGMRSYLDVKKVKDNSQGNLETPSFVIEVQKGGGAIPDSNSHVGGRFTLTSGTQSGKMRALSKSQAYFSRPADLWRRGDGKTELGSLYNPYWQARLVANNHLERSLSMSFHLYEND